MYTRPPVCLLSAASRVKCRVADIEVFAVEFLLDEAESFAEALEMHDLSFTQETDRVADFRGL